MHAAGHQGGGQSGVPVAGLEGVEGVGLAGVVQPAVGEPFKAIRERRDARLHVLVVAPQASLPRPPLVSLGLAPGLSRGSDGVGGVMGHDVLIGESGKGVTPAPGYPPGCSPGASWPVRAT